MSFFLSIFLALFAAAATAADGIGSFVTAEGRLVGAYQDDVHAVFVFLVLGILGTVPAKGPFFKGFAFLPAGSAHGTITNSLTISFASRVV